MNKFLHFTPLTVALVLSAALLAAIVSACTVQISPQQDNIAPQPATATVSPLSGSADPTTSQATPIVSETLPLMPDASTTNAATQITPADLAPISNVEVTVVDEPTRQVTVTVQGELPDSCTQIDQVTQEATDHTINVTITTRRPAEMMCAQVITPFTETVQLDLAGLDAGEYTVEVNGVTQSFQLPPQGS
ncbi:MAG: hypothetical protein R3C14_47740 [Caldilineaceae bacterium]